MDSHEPLTTVRLSLACCAAFGAINTVPFWGTRPVGDRLATNEPVRLWIGETRTPRPQFHTFRANRKKPCR